MTLIVNKQDPTVPGLHALIVGVSDYQYLPDPPGNAAIGFGMSRLASPALSAFQIYNWLTAPPAGTELAAPLKTCRVLLSPSQLENDAEPGLDKFVTQFAVQRPTRTNLQQAAFSWRADASLRKDDTTLFYFGGHGMRMSGEDGIMILDDFAQPGTLETDQCASIGRLRQAMAPFQGQLNIARKQFYFVDACRNLPEQIRSFDTPKIQDLLKVLTNVDEKGLANPTYFATSNGNIALGRCGKQSVFCEALLHALQHAAESAVEHPTNGTSHWPVTGATLRKGIARYLERKHAGAAPEIAPGGMIGDEILHFLASAPPVDIDIEVWPQTLANEAPPPTLNFLDPDAINGAGSKLSQSFAMPALTLRVPAGIYRLQVQAQSLPSGSHITRSTNINQALQLPLRVRAPGATA